MQAASLLWPTCGLNVLGLQAVCWELPVGLKYPASASVHSPADVRLVEFDHVPPMQGSGAAEPSGQ